MPEEYQMDKVENLIVTLRGQQVIIDRDVARLYGVETRIINQAVNRNKNKFPLDYMIPLDDAEKAELITKCDRFKPLKHSTVMPKAFTEKGLYMLATILKSPIATETTFAIIETFYKLRVVSRTIQAANAGGVMTESTREKVQKLMNDVMNNDPLPLKVQKLTFSLNLGVIKISVEAEKK